jgi:hypothetical protein
VSELAKSSSILASAKSVCTRRDIHEETYGREIPGSNLFDGFLVGSLWLNVNEAKGIGVLVVKARRTVATENCMGAEVFERAQRIF